MTAIRLLSIASLIDSLCWYLVRISHHSFFLIIDLPYIRLIDFRCYRWPCCHRICRFMFSVWWYCEYRHDIWCVFSCCYVTTSNRSESPIRRYERDDTWSIILGERLTDQVNDSSTADVFIRVQLRCNFPRTIDAIVCRVDHDFGDIRLHVGPRFIDRWH